MLSLAVYSVGLSTLVVLLRIVRNYDDNARNFLENGNIKIEHEISSRRIKLSRHQRFRRCLNGLDSVTMAAV